jgi:hypothetical protein
MVNARHTDVPHRKGIFMDPASVALLSSAVVSVLSPYLREAGHEAFKAIAGETGKKALAAALAEAKALYDMVANKMKSNDAAQTALARLKDSPDDQSAKLEFQKEFTSQIANDELFARSIADQLARIGNSQSDAEFVNNIRGDVAKLVQIRTVIGNVTL